MVKFRKIFWRGMPPDPPSLASPLRGSLFCITIQEKNSRGPRKMISGGGSLPSFGPASSSLVWPGWNISQRWDSASQYRLYKPFRRIFIGSANRPALLFILVPYVEATEPAENTAFAMELNDKKFESHQWSQRQRRRFQKKKIFIIFAVSRRNAQRVARFISAA